MAVRDGQIRINPTDGVMAEIRKSYMWEHKKRHALTITKQRAFTEFITDNKEYCVQMCRNEEMNLFDRVSRIFGRRKPDGFN